ncbi:unnamed protein product [Cyprideis torosa]|uniref:Uncharacterized protein n=1 Tax=Cyprideis torosa TaxID=163714 RepID=A0A7R8W0Y1_9CRUS|nr:unnamed protein product [Cyprideis torosa]CAG0879245.1 unnamed protein product [Cyprideis torosa]
MPPTAIIPTQQKLAEKLKILNDRGVGMMTRLYNIKKACSDPKFKPAFLSEKSLESTIKDVIKRFPHIESKRMAPIQVHRQEIVKSLSLYYNTFVDLMDFKDNVAELFNIMDVCKVQLDLSVNFDLTRGYLDLMSTYVSLMILLSRVDDRKAVLGLYSAAFEINNGQGDPSFPRLGQMIMEYEVPLKKLAEDFHTHSRLLLNALASLKETYKLRNMSADEWRRDDLLSLVMLPNELLLPETVSKVDRLSIIECISNELLSLDTLDKWIIYGLILCHQAVPREEILQDLWSSALRTGWTITLFRDEIWHYHADIIAFFDSMKGYHKRSAEVKELFNASIQNSPRIHRERRKFLRTALKELGLIFTDQPGLLGPKALHVFMGLCYARDEVHWLIRHNENVPSHGKTRNKNWEDLTDRHLPELLFHMEELRSLVKRYTTVIQRYYVAYLSDFDAEALSRELQKVPVASEEDSVILSSITNTISGLSPKQVDEGQLFDFRGLRIDWCRLQAYGSVTGAQFSVFEYKYIASLINGISYHTKLVDFLDQLLIETSDLSLFCFYSKPFETNFRMCLEFPAQNRFIVAFPLICSHFQYCTHELCPEERHHLRERSLSVLNMFLDEMAKEAKNIITTICDQQCMLSYELLPKYAAPALMAQVHRKKRDKARRGPLSGEELPGMESFRKTREELTKDDKLHMALTELSYAINYCSKITVWDYTFAPREFLSQHLEHRFAKVLVGMTMYNNTTDEIAKPSELLSTVRGYMNVLQTVENYVHIDLTGIFNSVLNQQTQPTDANGDKTVAYLYTQWYSDVLLRRVSGGQIIFSPVQRSFVSIVPDNVTPFSAEEYSDVNELRALADLVGPYGIKQLNETLMWHIARQVVELRKLVLENREELQELRTKFDNPEAMKDLTKRLRNVDTLLHRMTIIGVILCFHQLVQDALQDTLSDRIPFLLSSVVDFHHDTPSGDSMIENVKLQVRLGSPCFLSLA